MIDLIKETEAANAESINLRLTAIDETKANTKKSYNVLIPTAGWGDVAPYTQTINVSDMVSDGLPIYDLADFTKETASEFAKITKLETQVGKIILTALDNKPTLDLRIRIEVVY